MVDKPERKAEAEAEEETPDPNVEMAERSAEILNKQSEVNAEADELWAGEEPEEEDEPEPR